MGNIESLDLLLFLLRQLGLLQPGIYLILNTTDFSQASARIYKYFKIPLQPLFPIIFEIELPH